MIQQGVKQRGKDKVARIPIKVKNNTVRLKKPAWIRIKMPIGGKVQRLKRSLRRLALHTVCEEAACPNLGECFSKGTATFMILGDVCTRRCPFCDVAHGRPKPVDVEEPQKLAQAVQEMNLNYVVITSVDRDDLRDGGAAHFVDCIQAIRAKQPNIKIEVLVPDFRGRMEVALPKLALALPDVFNHNLETVPRLYKSVRPGADYEYSLQLLQKFNYLFPNIPTKSGLMLGLGETFAEVKMVIQDLYQHGCRMLTLGQYLQPSKHHLAVERFITPDEFASLQVFTEQIGFKQVASGPMVRSSYHADQQAEHVLNE